MLLQPLRTRRTETTERRAVGALGHCGFGIHFLKHRKLSRARAENFGR
jgi:hypothetical protein